MKSQLRLRAFITCLLALIVYLVVHWSSIDSRLKGGGLIFIAIFGGTIFVTAMSLVPTNSWKWIVFGIAVPFLASVLGYLGLAVVWAFKESHVPSPIVDLVVVALVSPYFACSVWAFSLYLLLMALLSTRVFRTQVNVPN